MQYILPYLLLFTTSEVINLIIFFLFFCVQIRYYLVYYRKPFNYYMRKQDYETVKAENTPKVSIIIEAENESERLMQNLPLILEQDYPDYEVIIVNRGSTDETDMALQGLSIKHPRLYHTYIPESYDKLLSSRKLALTVGLKAAKGDVVLFTESYSRPASNQWIRLMVSGLVGEKTVALGYSSIEEYEGFYNKMARFDNHYFSMQYMSASLQNQPYVGTYRNIAFRKNLFFESKGFASTLGLIGGDEVFLRRILTERNTTLIVDQDAFVKSDIDSLSLWRSIKKNYSSAKVHLGKYPRLVFPFEYLSRYIYNGLFVAIVVMASISQNWILMGVSALLWMIRLIYIWIILNKSTKHFISGKYYLSFLFYELMQPLYNLQFKGQQYKFKP